MVEPDEGALNHPAAVQNDKNLLLVWIEQAQGA